uniref:Retrovirus-related Pol polyprotein from transposon TNT 1-94-like beta-barrel domain-containing protein n=1 Tax=Chenopodium quinoa TaxID=63459 RepID=A0A803MD58_CHEQI
MAGNGTNPSSKPLIPIFKGEKYHLWSLKMKTMFKSQELWDLVENGYDEPNLAPAIPDAQLKENRKKDAKALFFIQSALDDDIFPRITAATSAHEAWETLKQEYLGDQRVIKVRLQTLRSDFAKLAMGEKEHVQNYLSRVTEIVSEMRSYESKDLSSFTFDELMGSLLAHESRMKKSATKVEEKAFQVKGESSFKGKSENSGNHGRGRGGFRGGRGRGRGGYHEDESRLFMAHSHISSSNHDVWFLDSGCSNQMSGARSLFKELDESKTGDVRLGDNKQMQVAGRGVIAIKTVQGDVKLLNVVFNEEARFKWNVDKDGIADYVPVDGEAGGQPAAISTTSSPASNPPSTPSSSTSESPSSSGSSDSRDTPTGMLS